MEDEHRYGQALGVLHELDRLWNRRRSGGPHSPQYQFVFLVFDHVTIRTGNDDLTATETRYPRRRQVLLKEWREVQGIALDR